MLFKGVKIVNESFTSICVKKKCLFNTPMCTSYFIVNLRFNYEQRRPVDPHQYYQINTLFHMANRKSVCAPMS